MIPSSTPSKEQAERTLDYTDRLKVMLHRYAEWFGGLHLEDCPQDDTCSCEAVAETNALLSTPAPRPQEREAAELHRLADAVDELRAEVFGVKAGDEPNVYALDVDALCDLKKRTDTTAMRQAAARLDALEGEVARLERECVDRWQRGYEAALQAAKRPSCIHQWGIGACPECGRLQKEANQ